MITLASTVSELHRVGQVIEKRLKRLGVSTVQDLLFTFPFRYEDYRERRTIASLTGKEYATVAGVVELIANKRSPRTRMMITEAIIADNSGRARAVWFGQPWIGKMFQSGDRVVLSGKTTLDAFGVSFVGANAEKESGGGIHTARLVPVYSVTHGITQKQMRFLMSQAIGLADAVAEWVPRDILERHTFFSLPSAIRSIHFPNDDRDRIMAERRLKFDELFLLQLRAEELRRKIRSAEAFSVPFHEEETKAFVARLPWTLTRDQKISAWEILQDIQKDSPMNRLLQGDVGSGKTAVAGIAIYNAALRGWSSMCMAPTEILARQHFESFSNLFANEEITVCLATSSSAAVSKKGSARKATKKELREEIMRGGAVALVGTHALLSLDTPCPNLALVIVDEQHRFGVAQRKLLSEKTAGEKSPHFLSMTATPIPRPLALTFYGDLDVSTIKTMPPGRKTIITRVAPPHKRGDAYQFIRKQVREGRQVFVICPRISEEGNESSEKKTVLGEYQKLSQDVFPDLRVACLHGKMKAKEKNEIMAAFANGQSDVLVSTSVVEVGVNVPNASVMVIEAGERFGLAQLHQFRGRVGRSSHQSYCIVFLETETEEAKRRLDFFEKTSDGFALAEFDLEHRGPGQVYGEEQSGMEQFRLATLRDTDLLKIARDEARSMDFSRHPAVLEKLREWEHVAHFE